MHVQESYAGSGREKVPLLRRKSFVIAIMAVILGVAFLGVPALVRAADPSGADTLSVDPAAAVNMAWTLIAGFLVWFMQLGFAFLGTGLIRAKNTVNYLTKSFMDFCIASLGFWAFGFALMFGMAHLVERVFKVDDVVGAVPVHFGAGIWGLLAVGIFADGTYGVSGLIAGEWGQLVLQIIDITAIIVWVSITVSITFWLIKKSMGLRASKEEELQGLDISEHGIEAYPEEAAV